MEVVVQISTIILTVLIGLAVGSFLNVVIYRLPNNMSLVKPASHCPVCDHELRWYDNIPLFSYLLLRGKCRYCGTKISIRYPLIELLNTILWFISLMMFTNFIIPSMEMNWFRFITGCIVSSSLICVFFIDLDHMEIYNVFHIILLACGVALLFEDLSWQALLIKAIGCLASALLFFLVKVIFKAIKHEDGLGMGDVFLVGSMGLVLGAYKILLALLLSCVVGGIILIIISAVKKDKSKQYPFAVILVPGFIVSMFVGDYIVNAYLHLLGVS